MIKDLMQSNHNKDKVADIYLLLFLCLTWNTQHTVLDQHGRLKQHHMFLVKRTTLLQSNHHYQ
jgi:hypothetical protein